MNNTTAQFARARRLYETQHKDRPTAVWVSIDDYVQLVRDDNFVFPYGYFTDELEYNCGSFLGVGVLVFTENHPASANICNVVFRDGTFKRAWR